MGNLTNVEVGSVILNMVDNVPSSISGATLWSMVDQERFFVEEFTGDTIGTSFGERYQPPIISLTAASVVRMMEIQGADTTSFKLGDLTIGKGSSSPTAKLSDQLREDGMQKLRKLGERFTYYKSLG